MKKYYISFIVFLFVAVGNTQIVSIPNANFKAKLLAANTINTIASTQIPINGNVASYNNIDTNGDGEIQISEANLITFLNVSSTFIDDLSGISAFSNLQYLDCSNNQLASLDLNSLTNLQNLYCSNNQLLLLNVNGLTNLKRLWCFQNQLTSLNFGSLINLESVSCSYNQLTTLDVNGFSRLEFLNCSNNHLTTLDVNSCSRLGFLNCTNNQLVTLFIKNNYTNWGNLIYYNNPNLTYICTHETAINTIQTSINYSSIASTCQVNSYCNFNPGGTFYTIQGISSNDADNNGCDSLDPKITNLKFDITDGTISGNLITNSVGNYSIPVQAGTHSITPQLENPSYFDISPVSATINFPAFASPFIQNFCFIANGVHNDLEIVIIPVDVARPGFYASYKIKYKNKGTIQQSATINFNFSTSVLDFISSSVTPTIQASNEVSWNISTIAPFQSGEIIVTLKLNSSTETPSLNANDVLTYTATINGLQTDETPDDNTVNLNQVIVNSFDPNDKICLEGNTLNQSMIGKYIHYKIRFENTGTAAAQNIVVKDIIDTSKFDIATLQVTDASHSCVTRITNINKVEFIFANINLPFDDANNDGFVVFKIKTKPTITPNATISNVANIYFDYNFPISTNTETSTFTTTLGNDTFAFDNYFAIYPNPVIDFLNIRTKNDMKILNLSVYSTLGQLLQTYVNPNVAVDVTNLITGTYFLKITTKIGISTSILVKE